jgi:hypothetical protein
MAASSILVASRYLQAREDQVFDALIDTWVDAAFDALRRVRLDPGDLEAALLAGGVTADALNEATAGKVATGDTTTLRALGGEILSWVWETFTHPFVTAWKLITSNQARSETKFWLKTIARKEATKTRHMMAVASTLARGGEVERAELGKAVHQFVDLLKTALILGVLTHHFGPQLIRDPLHVLGVLASPADELVGLMLDKPLRIVTRYLLGQGFGILPSSFYD